MNEICLEDLALADHIRRWDEYEGNLYELSARTVRDKTGKTVTFGVRNFGEDGNGRLALNGRTLS